MAVAGGGSAASPALVADFFCDMIAAGAAAERSSEV